MDQMELDDPIPEFDRLKKALESGGPFRLTTNVKYSLNEVPEDKRGFFHNALLFLDKISWTLTNEEELQFITNVIKEHPRIDMLNLTIKTDINITRLADAIESRNIGGIKIIRDCEKDITPILMALQKVACLQKLVIFYELNPHEYETLASVIQNQPLEEVYIYKSDLLGEIWISLTPVISAHKTLKTLNLPWSYGGAEGLKAITEIISKNSSIQKFYFNDDFHENKNINDTKMLCDSLKSNCTLTSLSTSYLKKEETKLVFETLAHNQVKLSALELNQVKINDETLQVLNDSLSTNTTLTSLGLTGCDLKDDTCQTLCRILESNKTITKLNLNCNRYGIVGIKAVCQLLMRNDRLKVLDLSTSSNKSTTYDEHCKEIAQMLRNNKSLTELNLSHNNCTDQGLNNIYEAMVHNTTLKKLMLDPYDRPNCLASNLTVMLARNKTLRHLQVMVDDSVKESRNLLVEGLAQNDSLTHLDLTFANGKNSNVRLLVRSLVEVLKDNHALTTVSIGRYNAPHLERLLRRNRQLKSSIKFLVAILSHNIALSSHALTILPREIWKQILSSITSPGLDGSSELVTKIFESYERKAMEIV